MDLKTVSIDCLNLSGRVVNILHRAGVFTVEELLQITEENLAAMPNVGRKSINEIMDKIRECAEWEQTGSWPSHLFPAQDDPVGQEELTQEVIKSRRLQDTGLSVRAINALQSAGIHTVGEMLALTEEDLRGIRSIGLTTIKDIFAISDEYRRMLVSLPAGAAPAVLKTTDSIENYEEWLTDENIRAKVIAYLKAADVSIDVLDVLSVKAYNILAFAGYTKLHQIIFMGSKINDISRMDSFSANEIRKNCRYYLREKKDEILAAAGAGNAEKPQQNRQPLTVYEMMRMPEYQEEILRYVRMNDLDFRQMDLSVRSFNRLSECGYRYLSDIILKGRAEFFSLPRMGNASVEEIMGKIQGYIEKHRDRIIAFVNGDTSVLVSEAAIRDTILKIYQSMGFNGLHLAEIMEKISLPETVGEESVKKVIGRLIAEGELEYIDFLIYRVYPSFFSYLDKYDEGDDRGIRYMRLKIQGQTLEAIAQNDDLTRERVRQIIKKTDRNIRNRYLAETGMSLFDEDYYSYLYTNYDVDREVCSEWLGIPVATYNYIDIFNSRGKRNISEALDDPELDVGLKLKINNYLHRDKIFINGYWVEKKRSRVEEYVLMKYCGDEMTYDDFCEAYNNFLAGQGIPYTEDLYYTQAVIHSRANRLADSRIVLWKQSQRLRYYDIDARDYTELFDTLNLDAYENTGISTQKFMENYPELMARYDIRDQYELHNLLKKIVPEGSYHDIRFGRMPGIYFGQFDFAAAAFEMLVNNSPISQNDLVDLFHEEYGFDRGTISANYLKAIEPFNHMGVYTIAPKMMPPEHRQKLLSVLTEDFYYTDEVRQIYRSLVPDADIEMINPYNLKSMGFIPLSRYVLQNWLSLEDYFRHLLQDGDIVDTAPLYKRYGCVKSWQQTASELKNNYDILEFEPNLIISFSKLERSGITKQVIRDFCDEVYRYMEDGMYFSAKSLRLSGFESNLYDLGFSDWFYANLLCHDPRFSYCNMLGTIILYKGKAAVGIKTFITEQVRRAGKIDIGDLINDLSDDFGCSVKSKFDITGKLQGSEIYYDPILERLYANAELYYRELDEDPEDMVI